MDIVDDYYKTLGVDRNASEEEITRVFEDLALKMHPERTPRQPYSYRKLHYSEVTSVNASRVLESEEQKKRRWENVRTVMVRTSTKPDDEVKAIREEIALFHNVLIPILIPTFTAQLLIEVKLVEAYSVLSDTARRQEYDDRCDYEAFYHDHTSDMESANPSVRREAERRKNVSGTNNSPDGTNNSTGFFAGCYIERIEVTIAHRIYRALMVSERDDEVCVPGASVPRSLCKHPWEKSVSVEHREACPVCTDPCIGYFYYSRCTDCEVLACCRCWCNMMGGVSWKEYRASLDELDRDADKCE